VRAYHQQVSSTPIIRYQAFDETNGLRLAEGQLLAYDEGRIVARAPLRADAADLSLEGLLDSYQVLHLLPALSFSYSKPRYLNIEIQASWEGPGEINGYVRVNGANPGAWTAHPCHHPDLTQTQLIDPRVRPWAQHEPPGRGFEFYLPPDLAEHLDPVIRQRAALALEAYVYALAGQRVGPPPFRRMISNIVSVQAPVWKANIPRIVSSEEQRIFDDGS
jgi:hypothetical protein